MASERQDAGLVRDAAARWDGTLDKTLRAAMIPYGYTATLWATGAYLVSDHGRPDALEAFVFLTAAICAFAVIATVSQTLSKRRKANPTSELLPIHPDSSHPIILAGLHILAAGIAFAGGLGLALTVGDPAWFFAPFTVTLLYLALSSFELALAAELYRRRALERLRVRQLERLRIRRWARTREADEPVAAEADPAPEPELTRR